MCMYMYMDLLYTIKSCFVLFAVNFGIIATMGCHALFAFAGIAYYLPFLAMVSILVCFEISVLCIVN